jgi:cytoskeleton protein RodZ
MSEVAAAPVTDEVSGGTLLRRAREAAGLHVAALAVSLKVPVRKIEALEEDRYEEIGDAVFIRALASSVCRTLKADPQPVLERLPQTAAPRLVKVNEGLNAPFRAPSDAPPAGWRDAIRQPVPLAVIALLVGALLIYVLPIRHAEEGADATPAQHAPAVAAAPRAASPSASEPAQVAQASQTPGNAAAAAPVPQASAVETARAAVAPPEPAPADASAEPSAPAAAVAASGIVVVRAKGESWVEVVDAKGNVGLRKLMQAGESAGASGALPLKVTIGKVDMTEVQVHGKPFDLKRVSQDNVARFEVK